jgi:hypothetical protein
MGSVSQTYLEEIKNVTYVFKRLNVIPKKTNEILEETTVKENLKNNEKKFQNSESLLTELSIKSVHFRAAKNILTVFVLFYCLQIVVADFKEHKRHQNLFFG